MIRLFLFFLLLVPSQLLAEEKPNIIYILADDLGYGDLGCYGQKKIPTPHIDDLARNGMRFTRHYSGSTVCAPSRAALLTGQHTGRTVIRGNQETGEEGQMPLPAGTVTFPKILKDAGYTTGAFGKWGLGMNGTSGSPDQVGFDHFYGYLCQRQAHHYYPPHLWDNSEKIPLKENADGARAMYAPALIHEKSLRFLEQNKDRPFFLFVPTPLPHAELLVPDQLMEPFRGKFLPEKSYRDAEDYYAAQPESHAAFAAMVTLLDQQVGDIVSKVKELGIEENTLIIFTSDNGPHLEGGADPDYFDGNGPLRGYKRDLTEGGIRVPMIATWPKVILPGSTTDHISAFWDVLPTVAELVEKDIPEESNGISFLPTLRGDSTQMTHPYLYWEFNVYNGRVAVLKDNWKLIIEQANSPKKRTLNLFRIDQDPGEQENLAAKHPEKVKQLYQLCQSIRTPSHIPTFEITLK